VREYEELRRAQSPNRTCKELCILADSAIVPWSYHCVHWPEETSTHQSTEKDGWYMISKQFSVELQFPT